MYAVLTRFNSQALSTESSGVVHSLHLSRNNAESSANRQITLQKTFNSKSLIAIVRIFNGRHRGDFVFPHDFVVLSVFEPN